MPPKRRRRLVPANKNNKNQKHGGDDTKEFKFTLNLNLGEVRGPLATLSAAQQRRQRSPVFVYCGLHCVLAIEKMENSIGVLLFILSVKFDPEDDTRDRTHLSNLIKDPIRATSDDSYFHASEGQAINLVGKTFPADVVKLCPLDLSLRSGVTKSELSLEFPNVNQDVLYRPYYESNWWGFGLDLLTGHNFRPRDDGAAIEIGIRFSGKLRPLGYLE